MRNGFRTLRRAALCCAWCVLLAVSVFAGPKIKVDKNDVNVGTIMEGTKKSVRHTFVIKNTGDEPLKIQEVKPG